LIAQEKKYKITTLEGRNQEKEKKYHQPHTDIANTQAQEKAGIGPAAAKRDRPPLNQQRDTDGMPNDVFKKTSDRKTAAAIRRGSKESRLGFCPATTLEG
jgi:hypothetical protein